MKRRLPVLETVSHVDLGRYRGTWCEIGLFPQSRLVRTAQGPSTP